MSRMASDVGVKRICGCGRDSDEQIFVRPASEAKNLTPWTLGHHPRENRVEVRRFTSGRKVTKVGNRFDP